MKALILAGGFGTRLRPLTNKLPKPILPICNKPFLIYQIELLKKAGIEQIILALHHQPEKIKSVLGNGSKYGVELTYMIEHKPLGTAGAFKNAENHLDDTTIVLNGDSILDFDIRKFINEHKKRNAISTIALTTVNDPEEYGVVEIERNGMVKSFNEKPSMKNLTSNKINAGVYLLERHILKMIDSDSYVMFEKDIFPSLLVNKSALFSYTPKKYYWIDIGSPLKFLQANIDFLTGKTLTFKINQQDTIVDNLPNNPKLKRSLVSNNCIIGAGCHFTNSVIGENCSIGNNVKLYNSVILPNAHIFDQTQIHSSVIGYGAVVNYSSNLSKIILADSNHFSSNTSHSDFP